MSKPSTASAADVAYDYLKSRILRAETSHGEFLTEGEVADHLGLSRTPVREAFHRLEVENLIRLVPRKGAFVPPITQREVSEVMEARRLIERWSCEAVVTRGLPVRAGLSRLLDEQRQLVQSGDVDGFIAADREFHRLILEVTSNETMLTIYDGLRDRQVRMGVRAIAGDAERIQQVLDEHARIASAFEGGDVDEVRAAVDSHLDATLRSLRDLG